MYQEPTEFDEELAKRLVAEGWRSISRRYGHIAKFDLPPLDQLIQFSPECPNWLRESILSQPMNHHLRSGHNYGVLRRTLTPAQMQAFKRAGGLSA